METTKLMIELPKDVSIALEKEARSHRKRPEKLAADVVSSHVRITSTAAIVPPGNRASLSLVVESTYGSTRNVNRSDVVSLAENEEFAGY